MRSVVEWLCHMEDLMKVHVHDNVSEDSQAPEDSQGIRFIRFIRFILFIRFHLITRITRITQGMAIHIKCSRIALYILKAFNSLCHKVCTEICH